VEDKGTAKSASTEISRLVGEGSFPNSKPVKLVQYLIDAAQIQSGIIMDFFAGSGTTAHAVLAQNALDGGNRSFVLVQLPEAIDGKSKSGGLHHHNIAEITQARIAAAIRAIAKSERMKNKNFDLGMKVLTLRPTNCEVKSGSSGT
jgi:adenine-specific DNA-methyltransferase